MALELRSYQSDVLARARNRMRTSGRRGIIQGECGSGKTVCSAELCRLTRLKGNRVLVLADRRRLVKQFGTTLKAMDVPYGVVMAGETGATREPVILASRDTLASWLANERELADPDLIIVDEVHRSPTSVYGAILGRYPKAYVIGLTATPARDDGRSLGDFFQWIECTVPASQLVQEGWLIKPEVYAPLELAQRRKKGDAVKGLAGDPVSHWRTHADGLPTIGFAANVAESMDLARRFMDAGIPAESIAADVSDDPGWDGKSERDRIYDRLADGRIKVLCSVGLLVEGVDIPEVSAAIVWCKCGSVVKWRQLSGRTMRPCPRIGKDRAVILDHSGAAGVHGLPGDDVEWSLDLGSSVGQRREKAIDEGRQERTVICQSCGLAYSGAPVCPGCGRAAPRAERKRTMAEQFQASHDAILERFDGEQARDMIREREQRTWMSSLYAAAKRNGTLGMAAQMFRSACGRMPWECHVSPLPESRGDWREKVETVFPQFVRKGATI